MMMGEGERMDNGGMTLFNLQREHEPNETHARRVKEETRRA
jgi:hypothetical protein